MILWLFYRNREVRKRISFSRTKSGRYLNRKTGFLSLQLIFHHFMYGMHIIIVINSAWLGLFLLDAIISFCAGTWVECCCCGRRRRRIANRTQRSNATFKWKQVFFFSSIELVWIVRHQSIISKSMDPINLYILLIGDVNLDLDLSNVFIHIHFECSSRVSEEWFVWRLIKPITSISLTTMKGHYSQLRGVSGISHKQNGNLRLANAELIWSINSRSVLTRSQCIALL